MKFNKSWFDRNATVGLPKVSSIVIVEFDNIAGSPNDPDAGALRYLDQRYERPYQTGESIQERINKAIFKIIDSIPSYSVHY
jgi:hypothetical protein